MRTKSPLHCKQTSGQIHMEPSISELLDDQILHMLLDSDGICREELERLVKSWQNRVIQITSL